MIILHSLIYQSKLKILILLRKSLPDSKFLDYEPLPISLKKHLIRRFNSQKLLGLGFTNSEQIIMSPMTKSRLKPSAAQSCTKATYKP